MCHAGEKAERTVDDILREVEDLKKMRSDNEPAVRFDDRVQTQDIVDYESLQGN